MKIVKFGIKSLEEGEKELKEAFLAAQERRPFKPRIGVYFTSLEAARNFLTPKKLEILRAIKEKNPKSLYQLAKIVGRSFPSIVRDVNILSRHGLIKLSKRDAAPRKTVQPEMVCDAINLRINI